MPKKNTTTITGAEYVIRSLGGKFELTRRLREHTGEPFSYQTVQSWETRKSIPTGRWRELIAVGDKHGVEITLDDFLDDHEVEVT